MLSEIADQPVWALVAALIGIATTQLMIAGREKRRQIRDRQMNLYLDSVADLGQLFKCAVAPQDCDVAEFERLRFETLARLSIIGTKKVIVTYSRFDAYVAERVNTDNPTNLYTLDRLWRDVTYAMWCDVRGKRHTPMSYEEYSELRDMLPPPPVISDQEYRDLCDLKPPPPVLDEPEPDSP